MQFIFLMRKWTNKMKRTIIVISAFLAFIEEWMVDSFQL